MRLPFTVTENKKRWCHRLLVALAFFGLAANAHAASAAFDFEGGSLSPVTDALPPGVTVSAVTIGTGLGDLGDNGAAPGTLRISADDVGNSTTTALATDAFLSFTVTIPAGVSVDFTSLALDTKGTQIFQFSFGRVYSSVHGTSDVVEDTIATFGRYNSVTDSSFITETIDLTEPSTAPFNGANVASGDFQGLTDQVVTIYLPWIDEGSAPARFMEIDNLTLTLIPTPEMGAEIDLSGLSITASGDVLLTLTGQTSSQYHVYRSADLRGEYYRKSWVEEAAGTFPASLGEATAQFPKPASNRAFFIAADSPPKARIMCVGDSITEGGSSFSVYRPLLNTLLGNAAYRFEFVGSKQNTQGGATLRHEGYGGQNAAQIATHIQNNFPSNIADIVLIHAGHNNDASIDSEAVIIARVETAVRSMIDTARANNPAVRVLVAEVITSTKLPKYSYIPALNTRLVEVAAELHSAAQPVIAVDHATGWDPGNHAGSDTISDLVHPNAQGAGKMAARWFDALVPLLD